MHDVFIALGTNIEPRMEHLSDAIQALSDHKELELVSLSSIYETKPVGYLEQADFLNMVVKAKTSLEPFALLNYCQQIEQELGRERKIRFGPRSIDLDILLFDNKTIEMEDLTVPHPRMHERAFVLVPLKEIAPGITFGNLTIEQWYQMLSQSDIDDVRLYNKKL
ncbi:2-amino-4-hydroxy-6-hydroxymethyldihydropteridine diphosphokinase [Filobacillus milosensis]|uniref:2-amino-4-hydroxy-6-hydroxymethyldihydropteridine diphosphokinase n=1 Tax=Filobacillus milosensis TaxID=94137 RepID=A0A4Y8IMI6_9BACI|nr:2-amino-4-hydroxy-6-hydroxymethyldihydropteridine diphosphokinase [Filobacillus milosensis]TFB21016.1 2-amino-4-hydroxy-6-hydroxymethyldihydropteridine diphosphokinase [Filobacillus milosensis]